jgi:NAD(P)H dehydrogenase (quinone)
MRLHLVHAHPETDSFVAAMRDTVIEAAQAAGAEVTLSDLYAMGFNPVLSAADFSERENPEHLTYALEQRHNFKKRTLAPDIQSEAEKILAADVLGFTFPLFWFGAPAILKGWIDRVFLSGPFFGGRRIYGNGGLAGKRAFAAISMGARPDMFGPDAIFGELESGMLRHFLHGSLGYVGLTVHKPFFAHRVPYVDAAERTSMLALLAEYVRTLEQQPLIEMPDLSRFDERMIPIRGNG